MMGKPNYKNSWKINKMDYPMNHLNFRTIHIIIFFTEVNSSWIIYVLDNI